MPQYVNTKCRGLYSFPNKLQTMPQGALVTANNVVINREDIIEPRRGFKIYGDSMGSSPSNDYAHNLFIYKQRILRHFGGASAGTTIDWDDGTGTFTDFSGTYAEAVTGTRIKGLEANGNFYLTTSSGVVKISAASAALMGSATIGYSGGIKALDGEAALNAQTGFFTQDSTVSYRIVWGIRDNNNNLIIGVPSERIILTNPITDLLIKDFNLLLSSLDLGAIEAGGDDLSDTDYNVTLKVPLGSSITVLQTALSSLCTKLNADFTNTDFNAAKAAIDAIVFSSSPTTTQLESLQDQLDDIVDILNGYIGAAIDSGANIFTNSTQSSTVDVTFTIPSNITTAHFYQIYRTTNTVSTGASVLSDLDPGDEHRLAYESNPTAGEITAGEVTVQDITPESFLGANLYTNPTSGEGIGQANEVPPFCKDIALFKGFTFYANTKTKHRLDLSLLSVADMISGTSTITLTNGSTTNIYTFITPVAEVRTVQCVADIAGSLNSKYFYLNSAKNVNQYYVWYNVNSAGVDPAVSGKTGIEVPLATGATANTVATTTRNVINQYDEFNTSLAVPTITITNSTKGICTDSLDGGAPTGFTITTTVQGAGENSTLVSRAGDVSSGSPTITNISSTADLEIGMYVSGTGIATGSKILSKTATTITLTINATATNAGVTVTYKAKRIVLSDLDTPSQQVDETARSMVRIINKNSSEIVNVFYLSGPEDLPGEILLESKTLSDTAFYLQANSTATGEQFSPTIPTSGQTNISTNEISPNRIYFSKRDQPEAVPLLNYQDVGPKDKAILRIIALRDSLFIIKEDSIHRLSGESAPFTVALFDSSTHLKATDSATVLNNQIYMYSDQGVASVSDTGISIISRPIEDLLTRLTIPAYTNFVKATWGVAYESDRSYYLFTVTETTDSKATQCFRYNTFTNTWTILPITKTCGVVNSADDKLYLAAGDTNYIEQERKSFDRTDHADRELTDTIPTNCVNSLDITLSSVTDYAAGDILTQQQYLTIVEYNRLLIKLDNDTSVNDADYYSTLLASTGDDLRVSLTALAAKLDADSGLTDSDYAATIGGYGSTFVNIQDAFNDIIDKLNLDTGAAFSNYMTSDDTTIYEVRIVDVNSTTSIITIETATPLIIGTITIYKSFESEVEWCPEKMGDPSMGKHASEATLMFESLTFTEGTMSFASDLDPSFEDQEFNGLGIGVFGSGVFGNGNFGGAGNSKPFRTLIPRNKQRCRFLNLKFFHSIARENYAIYGYSITANETSQRAYR